MGFGSALKRRHQRAIGRRPAFCHVLFLLFLLQGCFCRHKSVFLTQQHHSKLTLHCSIVTGALNASAMRSVPHFILLLFS
jgi:hypothetical protein